MSAAACPLVVAAVVVVAVAVVLLEWVVQVQALAAPVECKEVMLKIERERECIS